MNYSVMLFLAEIHQKYSVSVLTFIVIMS